MTQLLPLGPLSRHILSLQCGLRGIIKRAGHRIYFREPSRFLNSEELVEFSQKERETGCNCQGTFIRTKGRISFFELEESASAINLQSLIWHLHGAQTTCWGPLRHRRSKIQFFEFNYLRNPQKLVYLSYHLLFHNCISQFLHFDTSIDYQPEELISENSGSETVVVETPNAVFVVSEHTFYRGHLGGKYADDWRIVAEAHKNSLLALFKPEGFDISFESTHDSPRTSRLVLERRKRNWVESIR
ncbi:MAG: hypothetical protein ACFFCQ_08105 [Promethearchaeota archaeon]